MSRSQLSNVQLDLRVRSRSHSTATFRLISLITGVLAVTGCSSPIVPPAHQAKTDDERFFAVALQFDSRPVQSKDVSVVAKQPLKMDVSFGVAPQYAVPNPKASIPQQFPGSVSVLLLADGGRRGELIKFRAALGGSYADGKANYSGRIAPKVPPGLYEFRVVCEPDQVPASVPAVNYTVASTLVRIE